MAYDPTLEEWKKLYQNTNGNRSNFIKEAKSLGVTETAAKNAFDGADKMFGKSTNNSSGGGGSGGDSGGIFNFKDKISGAVSSTIATQEQTGYMPGLEREMLKTSEITGELVKNLLNIKNPLDILKSGFMGLVSQAELYLTQQTELLGVINKNAGLTGQLSEDVRDELTYANIPLTRLGIGFAELADAAKDLVSQSGRFLTLNRDSWYEAGAAATAYVGTLSELVNMYPEFEKVGIGASEVAQQISETGSRSLSLGLQSSKTTKELSLNLSKLNEYGFKDGVKGLSEMVRKSTELRMNMDSVFKIADDVMDPEKAISLSANLQVLGGAIGAFGDPLRMMYDATNNVEGLQDALIGAAGSLATYNSEQGRFEITGVNLRRAKAMAQELGISYNELANGAIAAAERTSASAALMGRGLNLDEDQERFLTNISQMKGGQMTIELNSDRLKEVLGVDSSVKEIALEKLTKSQVDTILKYQDEFKKLSPEEIIQKQATTVENIARDVNFLAAASRVTVARAGGGMLSEIKKMINYDPGSALKKTNELTNTIADKIGIETPSSKKRTSATPKTLESMNVENRTTTSTTEDKSNVTNITKQDMKEALMEVHTSTKNEKNRPITINNNLEPVSPGSYLKIDSY
jgi:hypothetical protein